MSLYNYRKGLWGYSSKAQEQAFFFSPDGRKNPLKELRAAIEAFSTNKTPIGHVNQLPQCAFVARFQRLREKWPHLFPRVSSCSEFEKWKANIGARSVSIPYVGAYPNNPASMFGHTLLRLERENSSWLLDYTIAFLANVDPEDGPISYTFNGITGGYTGFYNIEPYYVNAGQYNNGESRDIWEYKLDLTGKEVEFLLKHLWEVSLNTGFPYYFLDENCSYYLQTLLNTVSPRFSVVDSSLLLHPIESVKGIRNILPAQDFRPSLKKQLYQKLELMSKGRRSRFRKLVETNDLAGETDPLVLDAFIEYLKARHYGKDLDEREQKIFEEVQVKRAAIEQVTEYPAIQNDSRPLKIHPPSKIFLARRTDAHDSWKMRASWGYHGMGDSEEGTTLWSFIDYLGLEIEKRRDHYRIDRINLVDIYSLNPLRPVLPQTSWRASLKMARDCFHCKDDLNFVVSGGWGLSQENVGIVTWQFINIEANGKKGTQKLSGNLEAGGKLRLGDHYLASWLRFAPIDKGLESRGFINYQFYFAGFWSFLIQHRYQANSRDSETLIGVKGHF